VGKEGISIGRVDDDVVADQWPEVRGPFEIESQGMLQNYGKVSCEMHRISLGPAVLGLNNGPTDRGIDGLPPPKAILQSHAEDKVVEHTVFVEAHRSGCGVCAYEVIGVPLAEHVGPVTWNLLARGVGGYPFAPEREVHDGWSGHKRMLHLM
jgi:hypothetical protein